MMIIDGFQNIQSAMQCEWRLKRGKKGVNGRINNGFMAMNNECWTSKTIKLKIKI